MNPGDLVEISLGDKKKVGLITGPGSSESVNIMFDIGEFNLTLDQLRGNHVKIKKLLSIKR